MKIALIGGYPPPYGGISIHIQRLKAHLDRHGHECVVYSPDGRNTMPMDSVIRQRLRKTTLNLTFSRDRIIHYHSTDWRGRVFVGLMGLMGKKTVLSLHGETLNDSIREGGWPRRHAIKFALRHTSFIIADNPKIEDLVLSLGIRQEKVRVIPAFIPPEVREEDYKGIPQYIWDFMNQFALTISANGWATIWHGEDCYGIDLIIELVKEIKKRNMDVGIVFRLCGTPNPRYWETLLRQIKRDDLETNLLVVEEDLPAFYPIIRESNIFIRPTITDGDAVSIREALFFKKPTVASDVIKRPDHVILFKNRDVSDFIRKNMDVLENYETWRNCMLSIESADFADEITEVYKNLAEK